MMADQHTMAQLLQAPTKGYEDTIVVLAITADNFELKHEPPRSIFTWNDLVSKFISQLFPPSKTTNLRNEITNFQQCFDESFSGSWDRFKDLLRACHNHGFSKLHQLDTFYNALNSKDQDSLNSVAGGNFLDKMPREWLAIIESKSKVRYSCNKPVVAKVSTNTSTSGISPDVAELKDIVKALLLDKKSQNQAPSAVKAVKKSCVSKEDFSAYVKANDAVMRNMKTQGQNMKIQLTNLTDLLTKFVNSNNASTSSSGTLHSNTIANPRNDLKAITTRSGVSYDGPEIPPWTSFLPKVVENEQRRQRTQCILLTTEALQTSNLSLLTNKDKLCKLTRTPLNEHCLAVLLKKVPEKLGDPDKFLIPCDFLGKEEFLALSDLGASINIMPLSVWNKLSLPDLTPTCMTLKLADCSIYHPIGFAEDVYVKVGSFHFSADFVVVDFHADPRVPLILERSFLKKFWGFFDVIVSVNPTPYYYPIVSITSSTLTPFENIDFLLEEVDAFLAIEDDPTSPKVDQSYLDSEGGILFLEAFLNDDPSLPPLNQGNYLPEVCKELKICEAKSDKSSIDEPPKVELKNLPPHLEYAFLEGDGKLPIIIVKYLNVEEKTALITVLKLHNCLSHLERMLKRCEDTNLCLNWEKSHFIVKEGIVLGHEISMQGIEVDKSKVDVINKLPYPTTVKCIRSFLVHVGFYRRFIKDFSKISRPIHYASKTMTEAKSNYTTTEKEMLAVVDRGTHFYNDQFAKVMQKFGVTHRLETPYHSQKSGQVETAGDHRKVQLNELNELRDQAYENSLTYNEKTKRLHDSKIKELFCNIGDIVLLFNSQLNIFSGKLKSRWSGLFTISHVYPYGIVELAQPDGPNFKVNGHRLNHYFGEDVPKMVVPNLQTFPKDY
nr:reverse transcriptase domain-containing protein [Tanacetum cinerariifolium]